MENYTLTKIQDSGCTYYAIFNNDSMEYFAGYDFMGSATWEKHLDDCSWLLEDEAYQIKADLESADADDQHAEKGFFWSDEIKALDDAITHTLSCLAECHTEKERKFFKDQYKRFEARRVELANDWLAIW